MCISGDVSVPLWLIVKLKWNLFLHTIRHGTHAGSRIPLCIVCVLAEVKPVIAAVFLHLIRVKLEKLEYRAKVHLVQ